MREREKERPNEYEYNHRISLAGVSAFVMWRNVPAEIGYCNGTNTMNAVNGVECLLLSATTTLVILLIRILSLGGVLLLVSSMICAFTKVETLLKSRRVQSLQKQTLQ